MQVLDTIGAIRAARSRFGALGLVPTMGFLHDGHLSLVRRAKADCGAVAVSIFVNPTQFGPNEDLARYPRDLPRDLALLEAEGVDLVFAPGPEAIYPPGFATRIEVGGVSTPLEGAARPGHFSGVATVVAKLFNIVQPSHAYFGQKDVQQTVVIRRMASDLDLPVEVVVVPTVREVDGLALSSRNVYLDAAERAAAPVLFAALSQAGSLFASGERRAKTLRAAMREVIATQPSVMVDYVSIASADTLEELDQVGMVAVASLAARIGRTRLIDNVLLEASQA